MPRRLLSCDLPLDQCRCCRLLWQASCEHASCRNVGQGRAADMGFSGTAGRSQEIVSLQYAIDRATIIRCYRTSSTSGLAEGSTTPSSFQSWRYRRFLDHHVQPLVFELQDRIPKSLSSTTNPPEATVSRRCILLRQALCWQCLESRATGPQVAGEERADGCDISWYGS